LIALLLRVSAAVNNPSAGNVASLIGEARTGWSDIIAPGKQDDEAADPFGGQVTFRLKAEVANALRQCEERGVDADRLRGAVTEIELLLDELVGDDIVVVDAVQDPDRFEKVISERVQRRRRNVEAKSEPFFDALVRAVTEEFVRRAPRSESFRIGALRQLLDGIKEILEYLALIEEYILESESGPGSPRPSRIRLGSRPMEAVGFVERREQARLSDAVFAGASGRTVLTGMRGSGKSQLATAVAARCEAQGWPLVAWVPAGSREAVLSGLVELGLELGVRVEDGPSREVIARRCLTALASAQGSNRLIVFDDVKNPDDLVGLVPRGEGVRVLVTTTRLAGWEGAGWVHVPVGVFEREQSISVLLDRTGSRSDRGTADVEAADGIAGALGDLPVAVVQAAATARRDRYTLAAYLDMLERTTLEEGVRRWEGDEYPEAVGAALRLALQSTLKWIKRRSPHREAIARAQLGILSVLAASGVPVSWLEKRLDKGSDDARGALSGLIESSVCQLSEDDSKVVIHGLQSRVIREVRRVEPERWGRVEEAATGLLGAVADVIAVPVSDSVGRRREALDLVEQLRAAAGQDYSESLFSHLRTADALAHALRYAAELGRPQAALSLADAVDLLDKTLGPDHTRTLTSRNNLANAYRSAGRLKEAIDLHKKNLADRLRVLGADHPDTLTSRNNLALAYQSAGRLEQAIPLYEQNLADRERILDPNHPDILTSRSNLAGAYKSAGRLDEAIDLFERTLADRERLPGPDHADTLTSRNNLALAYQSAGRLDEAIGLFERTLADRLRVLSPDHADTLSSRNNLASAYKSAGRPEQAIGLHKKNLADRLRVLGADHPDTLTSRNNLASAYRSAGRPEQAIGLHKKNLVDRERVLGPDHPHTLSSRNNLAGAYRSAGRLDEAIDLFEQNLADRERVLGPDHPYTLVSRNNLASAYQDVGRLDEAIDLFERNLAEALRVLGPGHPDTSLFRNNLVTAYRAVGRDEDAAALFDPPPDPDDTDTEAPS